MKGWVTWLGAAVGLLSGLGAIATGAAGMLAHYVNPASSVAMQPDAAMAMIQGGFIAVTTSVVAIGIGRKLDKNTEAVKETKPE